MFLVSLVVFFPISAFELFNSVLDRNHLNKSIYREVVMNMSLGKRILDYVKSFWSEALAKFIGRVIAAMFLIVGFFYFLGRAMRAGIPENRLFRVECG
ncbi:hypothetical protein HMPREF2842_01695 [Rothia sp. HMSC069C10]|nr:hypothetical protein HMPREF2842_01695 [Rothia sp. HMSC069C10]